MLAEKLRCVGWRRRVSVISHGRRRRRRRWRGFRHGPHVHGNSPVWLDHCFPDLWEDDFAIGADEVVVAFVDVGADYVDVEEGLFDEFFHALRNISM